MVYIVGIIIATGVVSIFTKNLLNALYKGTDNVSIENTSLRVSIDDYTVVVHAKVYTDEKCIGHYLQIFNVIKLKMMNMRLMCRLLVEASEQEMVRGSTSESR